MIELVLVSILAAVVLGLAFYQSHREKERWKRVSVRKKNPPAR
jgi:type II secretory pathway pseudopilin PulG